MIQLVLLRTMIQLLLLCCCCCCVSGAVPCTGTDEILCAHHDKCIKLRFVCDKDRDCSDHSDEDQDLCAAWRNDCLRGEVRCRRGEVTTCISVPDYCTSHDPPCEGDLDLRLCQMLHDKKLQPLNSVVLKDFGRKQTNLEMSEEQEEQFQQVMNLTIQHPECPLLYTLVGTHCLSLFFPGTVGWGEARAFCRLLDGDLVTLEDLTSYYDLLRHLRRAGMTTDFWVGGRYLSTSDGWTWLGNTPMDLGSPYWALRHGTTCQSRNVSFLETGEPRPANPGTCYHYQQAPHQDPSGWCAALTYQHYYYITDEDCLLKKSPLCIYTNAQDLSEHLLP
nr:uncharacterized protein LOC128699326 [Cherax quadricarinatus]XP_053647924.1 uncharacterized protein LOC128699326 [Cherax quadricarinatus]